MTRRVIAVAISVAIVGGLTACGSSSRLSSPLSYDRSQPLDARTNVVKTENGVQLRDVSYRGWEGQTVPALLAVPAARRRPGPCLVYAPGIGTTKEQSEFLFPGLARLGVATFVIDARFTGARGGPAALVHALRDPRLLVELLRGTAVDERRALDYLDASGICDRRRIGFMGLSFGALIGTLVAGSDTRVRATVLMSAGGDTAAGLSKPSLILPEVRRTKANVAALLRLLRPYEPERWVGRIAPRPILFVEGLHDPNVSVSAAEALFRAAHQPKYLFFDTGGHIPYDAPDVKKVYEVIVEFLKRELIDVDTR